MSGGNGARPVASNVVLTSDSRIDTASVSLRPISEKINIMPEAPRPPSGDPAMHFFEVRDGQGYD